MELNIFIPGEEPVPLKQVQVDNRVTVDSKVADVVMDRDEAIRRRGHNSRGRMVLRAKKLNRIKCTYMVKWRWL